MAKVGPKYIVDIQSVQELIEVCWINLFLIEKLKGIDFFNRTDHNSTPLDLT